LEIRREGRVLGIPGGQFSDGERPRDVEAKVVIPQTAQVGGSIEIGGKINNLRIGGKRLEAVRETLGDVKEGHVFF
jgi:hypothetical protein